MNGALSSSRAERWGAVGWAVLSAAVILLPHIVHAARYGLDAFPLSDGVDGPMYLVLAQRAPPPGEADTAYAHLLFEESGRPLPRRYISLGALAWAASQVGLGGARLFLLMDVVCPLAFFWLLYRWLRELGVGWGLRIAACTWFVLCHTWFIQLAYYALHWWRHGYGSLDVPFLQLNRPLNPQWSLLGYTAAVYLLWRYVRAPSARLQAAAAACGLYAETIQGPYLGGPFWAAWLYALPGQVRRRDWRAAGLHVLWLAAAAGLLGLLVRADGAPGHFLLPDAPGAAEPSVHAPLLSVAILGGWVLAALMLAFGRAAAPACGLLVWAHVAVLLCVNQHMATGRLHHPDHFTRALKVTVLLGGCVLLARAVGRLGPRVARLGRTAGHVAAALFLANGTLVQLRSVDVGRPSYDRLEAYRGPLAWLAAQPRGVVAAYAVEWFAPASSYRTPTAVLLGAPHRFLAHSATPYGYPVRERVVRWAIEARLRGVREMAAAREAFYRKRGPFEEMMFGLRYHHDAFGAPIDEREASLRRVVDGGLAEAWNRPPRLRVDYVVDGPFERDEFGPIDPARCAYLRPAYPEGPPAPEGVRIYRVDREALRSFLDASGK